MARGFLSGAILGGIVSVAGAGLLSVLAYPPSKPEVAQNLAEVAEAPKPDESQTADALQDADLVTEEAAPQVTPPSGDDVAPAQTAGQDTAPRPETGDAAELAEAQEGAAQAGIEVLTVEPVLPSPQAALPEAPGAEELSISTDPAQPPAPEVDTDFGIGATEDASPSEDLAALAPERASPAPTAAPNRADAPAPGGSAPVEVDGTTPAPATPEPDAEETVAETATPEPQPQPEPKPKTPVETAQADDATENADGPRIGRPANSLIDRSGSDAEDTPADNTAKAVPDGPPIESYAAIFENPEDKPLMSIVLLDEGADLLSGTIGIAALRSFPYPLSFAIDMSLPDAKERMQAYRDEGFEVLAMMDLPAGATAADAEVNLGVALSRVPEAVALIEGTGTGWQESRATSEQLIAALRDSGHGVILQDNGLNSVERFARNEGVPTGLVFRDFDSAGQTPTVIRRFLDQAAFRAGQQNGVIMLGRLRPDTVSALLVWGLQERASRVALAPVSAVLRQESAADG